MSTGVGRFVVRLVVRRVALLVLCFACLSGCKKQVPLAAIPPPAVQPAPSVAHEQKLPEPPVPQTSEPSPATEPTIPAQTDVVVPPPPQEPAPKKVKKPRPRKPATPPAPAPIPVQTAKVIDPPPSPKLEQLLSPGQEQGYNQTIDHDLQRARNNLTAVRTKPLSESQKAVVLQVQSFIKQAEDLRKTDLVEAKGLSHKADVLASDLARSVQ